MEIDLKFLQKISGLGSFCDKYNNFLVYAVIHFRKVALDVSRAVFWRDLVFREIFEIFDKEGVLIHDAH